MGRLLCPHCWQEVRWSKIFYDWWCDDCRTHDTYEEETNEI